MTLVDQIGRSKYVSLTTYRKDGTSVATPVWQVRDGDELIVISDADAWKVKRIRRDSRVVVTVCDFRGRIAAGAPTASGEARILDEAGSEHARTLIGRKYLSSRVGNWFVKVLHLPKRPVIGIAVTLRQA